MLNSSYFQFLSNFYKILPLIGFYSLSNTHTHISMSYPINLAVCIRHQQRREMKIKSCKKTHMTPAGLPIYTAQSNLNKFTNDGHCINYTIFHELTDGMRLHRVNNNHTRPGGRALVKCINRPFKTAHRASGSARGACPCRAFFSLFLDGFSNPSLPRWSAIWQKFPIHTHGAAPP